MSLNEDEQVRYHGRASGLHLLSNTERHDRRNEGGIWRFPKARVWPPVSNKTTRISLEAADEEYRCRLPELRVQEELLDLVQATRTTTLFVTHSLEEALLLGDRVLVMSARPGRIIAEHHPPFPRPRTAAVRDAPEFTALKGALRELLRKEAVTA